MLNKFLDKTSYRKCPETEGYTIPSSVCEREWGANCSKCKFSVNKYTPTHVKIITILIAIVIAPIYANILINF